MIAVDVLKQALGLPPLAVLLRLSKSPAAWSALERVVDPPRWLESAFWAGHGFVLPVYETSTRHLWLRARDLALAEKGPTLEDWLENPMRSTNEVKRALVRAIQQARTGGRHG